MTREEKLDSRRLKYLKVARYLMAGLFNQGTNGNWVQCEGMPADAEIVAMSEHACFITDEWVFKVWSSTFPVMEQAMPMEELTVVYRHVEPPKLGQGREFI